MLGLGMPEILVILVLVLILFGAGKLPKVMGDLGRGVNAFKDGLNVDEQAVKKVPSARLQKSVVIKKRKAARRKAKV